MIEPHWFGLLMQADVGQEMPARDETRGSRGFGPRASLSAYEEVEAPLEALVAVEEELSGFLPAELVLEESGVDDEESDDEELESVDDDSPDFEPSVPFDEVPEDFDELDDERASFL